MVLARLYYVKAKDKVLLVEASDPHRGRANHVLDNDAIAGDVGDGASRVTDSARRALALELFGAFFHCVRLSPITFIAVMAAWLRLA